MAETSANPETTSPTRTEPEGSLSERSINTIRTLAMDAVQAANSGHPGTPMALAPLAYALWTGVMRYDGRRPDWADRDRFVLSCGHASMLLYAMLHLTGEDLKLDEIKAFRQWGSRTAGHPESYELAGIETTTGPLGQGFGNAVGMALAERMLASRFNRPGHTLVDHRTWVIASDGDLMEGVCQEAASLAGHLGLEKLCVFYDDNRITIDGPTDLSFTEDVAKRFEAYGWRIDRVSADAQTQDYVAAAEAARAETGRPTLVICRTHIGYGSPHKQDTAAAHGAPLGEEEVRLTKRNLGWPEDAQFLVPEDVLQHMRDAGRRGGASSSAWDARLAAYGEAHPDLAAEWTRTQAGALPDGWAEHLPSFPDDQKPATRKASGQVLAAIGPAVPELVGGSADLTGSNNTDVPGGDIVAADHYGARNLRFGVREHAMGALMNGMALHGGLRPYGGTFLVFSDYMRPSVRLAALMGLRVVYVFTHDSIGLGEDGPTHQPVEHLAALRAIPGLDVIRPADGAETAEAWRAALEAQGPTALVLSRQGLPALGAALGAPAPAASALARGAYVVRSGGETPHVVFLASGSEVHVALGAAALLAADGVEARVVSMPSWRRFEALSSEDRQAVLGPEGTPRVAVEAAASFGWHRWVGARGGFVTLDRFGASAPGPVLMREFGFTPEHAADTARALLGRR